MIHVSTPLRPGIAVLAGACMALSPFPAGANGRFPGADQLVVDPSDPEHLLVRATFGFVETRDGGRHWSWICEEAVGAIGTADPTIAITGDGTIVVSVPFEGVAVTHDHGCSWSRAPAPLVKQLVVDSTLEPSDPAALVVLTSTNDPGADLDAAFEFSTLVVETKDNARTWSTVGVPLPRDFIAATIEIARSDPDRIYVGGVVGIPPSAAIERSSDRGKTWNRTMLAAPTQVANLFVSAIDPRDAERLWIRVASPAIDMFGTTPTLLATSADHGDTWTHIAETRGPMLGFALSPDGTRLAYGSQDGVLVGTSDGSDAFDRVSTIQNRGLTWTSAGLYACATDSIDPFAIGLSTDEGRSFEPIYRLRNTCPQVCPDDTPFDRTCRGPWVDPTSGVASRTAATGQACTVPWASMATSHDGGSDDGGVDGGTKVPEGSSSPPFEATGGCACGVRRGANQPLPRGASIALVAALAVLRRRGRERRITTAHAHLEVVQLGTLRK
jgi:photosystem II stability/assembly factor-like uncharacterized protein